MIARRTALALRGAIVRSAHTPLGRAWKAGYDGIAATVARRIAPDESRASVFLTGSLASGEPLLGLSDIDLVVVAADGAEAGRAQARFGALCRALPPLGGLMPHVWIYSSAALRRVRGRPYPVLGEAAFTGPHAGEDRMGLLERPGLGAPGWKRVRGRLDLPAGPPVDVRIAAWLELQHRWRYAFIALREPAGPHAARLCSGLVSEAARIWLLLAHGEDVEGRSAPLRRALALLDDEQDGLAYALRLNEELHRSPRVDFTPIVDCFVRLSARIADVLDEQCFAAGATPVELVTAGDGLPLVDWRALALPAIDWTAPELPFVREERLRLLRGDPAQLGVFGPAAGLALPPWVTVLRHGSLLVAPTDDVWVAGRMRLVQCSATDPVSFAVLAGERTARFPDVPGRSVLDCARQAVAEHRAWLAAPPDSPALRVPWLGPLPPNEWATPALVGLLLAAARAALLLESAGAGPARLPLTLADAATALGERYPETAGDAAEAAVALVDCRRLHRAPGGDLVRRLHAHVLAMASYSGEPA